MVFVNLKDAFPSTHIPTLWFKMFALGVAGPLFDWLRMLYKRISFLVRHNGELSDSFKSMIGVLTGDTASPMLWNIYFHNVIIPDDEDDIILSGQKISHVEQADDVMNAFCRWASANLMTVSIPKTKWMIFGPLPSVLLVLTVNGQSIDLVEFYKFVGIHFQSTHSYMFAKHYQTKVSKARSVSNATFAVEDLIGSLPPRDAKILYMARVDPHLIFGAEVVLDIDGSFMSELAGVQQKFEVERE